MPASAEFNDDLETNGEKTRTKCYYFNHSKTRSNPLNWNGTGMTLVTIPSSGPHSQSDSPFKCIISEYET